MKISAELFGKLVERVMLHTGNHIDLLEKRNQELETEKGLYRRGNAELQARVETLEADPLRQELELSKTVNASLCDKTEKLESENDLLTQANYKWEQDCDRLTLENEAVRQGNADLIAQVERLEQDSQKLDEVIDYWHSQTLQAREDAELGRLVRAMPDQTELAKMSGQFCMRWIQNNGLHTSGLVDKPEDALIAADVMERLGTLTPDDRLTVHPAIPREYCPNTDDHFCPKEDNCTGSVCALSEAVKS